MYFNLAGSIFQMRRRGGAVPKGINQFKLMGERPTFSSFFSYIFGSGYIKRGIFSVFIPPLISQLTFGTALQSSLCVMLTNLLHTFVKYIRLYLGVLRHGSE